MREGVRVRLGRKTALGEQKEKGEDRKEMTGTQGMKEKEKENREGQVLRTAQKQILNEGFKLEETLRRPLAHEASGYGCYVHIWRLKG